jgi:hypothetical protein
MSSSYISSNVSKSQPNDYNMTMENAMKQHMLFQNNFHPTPEPPPHPQFTPAPTYSSPPVTDLRSVSDKNMYDNTLISELLTELKNTKEQLDMCQSTPQVSAKKAQKCVLL